ncbi:MAG: copper amine oxidase N-terminal domain-containing protein [Firmicutes bacterium]|nr:copper amine oxidase N-terminal domain-containing protein [Bacillota bacterium]
MVPLRAIAEGLGALVYWDGAHRLITIVKAELTVKLTIGSRTAEVNGKRKSMDTVPVIQQNRTMVPLRYVGELGASVDWDGASRTVTVNLPHQ